MPLKKWFTNYNKTINIKILLLKKKPIAFIRFNTKKSPINKVNPIWTLTLFS
jgi:hypothetical protein